MKSIIKYILFFIIGIIIYDITNRYIIDTFSISVAEETSNCIKQNVTNASNLDCTKVSVNCSNIEKVYNTVLNPNNTDDLVNLLSNEMHDNNILKLSKCVNEGYKNNVPGTLLPTLEDALTNVVKEGDYNVVKEGDYIINHFFNFTNNNKETFRDVNEVYYNNNNGNKVLLTKYMQDSDISSFIIDLNFITILFL